MRKYVMILATLLLYSGSLKAQSDTLQYAIIQSELLRNNAALQLDSARVSEFDCDTGSIQVRAEEIQNGYNLLVTDLHTHWKLYLIAQTAGGKIVVTGFSLQNRNGKMSPLGATGIGSAGTTPPARETSQTQAGYSPHPDLSLAVSFSIKSSARTEPQLPDYDF